MKSCCIFCSIIIWGSLFLCGCGGVLEAEELAVPLGTGCELAGPNNLLEISAQFSVPAGSSEQGAGSESKFIVLTSTGRTVTEATSKLAHMLARTPEFNHVQSFIMGEKLAQINVGLLADFIIRIPDARQTTALFVSQGNSPDEILNTATPLEDFSGLGLANMISIQERQIGIYQPVYFGDFFNKLTKNGIEPVVPQVTIENNGDRKVLKLAGTAVFRKNRMVGELDESESRAFHLLNPRGAEGGLFIVTWDNDTLITMENIRIRAKNTALIDKEGSLKMKIELNGEGNFYEQTANAQILTLDGIKKVNQKTEQQIKHDIEQCIKKVQLMGSDIFGWGLIFQQQYPAAWEHMKSDWPHYFAQIEPQVTVTFETRRTYLIDQSFTFRE